MNKDEKGRYVSVKGFWNKTKWLWRNRNELAAETVNRLGIAFFCFSLMLMGAYAADGQVKVQRVEAEKAAVSTTIPPILQKIAKCESKTGHKANNGQVSYHVNTNGTIDSGKFMINTVWFAKATELGYDVFTEKGNEQMALWLYENKGTEPWYSSAKCWAK